MHYTNKGKINWDEIPDVVVKLNRVYEIFINCLNLKENITYIQKEYEMNNPENDENLNTDHLVTLPYISPDVIIQCYSKNDQVQTDNHAGT